jgi:hypothetical protein
VEDAAAIAIAVGGVTAANELLFAPAVAGNTGAAVGKFNWRIIPATAIFAVMLDGLAKLSPKLATGIGVTALVTVLFTKTGNAPAPAQNLDSILGFNNKGNPQAGVASTLLGG